MPKVLNVRTATKEELSNSIYCGRPSIWGNPFTIGKDGTRSQVILKYIDWLETQPLLLSQIHVLQGKNLVCWCAPQQCHCDILLEIANS
jgi:bacteriorhodopsin